jgi:hypothetical protein
VAIDEQTHVALPKLMGAPAYARPPRQVSAKPRPFDPDDLPIEAHQTDDERRLVEALPARAFAPGGGVILDGHGNGPSSGGNGHRRPTLQPRPFRLSTLAGKILRRAG